MVALRTMLRQLQVLCGCLQDVESQLNSATTEKNSLQLSVERAQSELTEQKRLTDSLQLVSTLFSSHLSLHF